MRVILDPHVALVLDGSQVTVLSSDDAVARMRGVTGVTVALTDITVADSVAPVQHLRELLASVPGGKLNLIDRIGADLAQGFFAARDDVQRLHAASATVTVTAYPLALRRGLERRNLRPEGRWVFLEVAGPMPWLSVWDDARLVQWRQITTVSDLGAEIARSLHQSQPADGASGAIVALTPSADLQSVLAAQEGIRAELLQGSSPAFDGLHGLASDTQFWLPELLHAEEERRLRQRRLFQRAVAVAVLAGTIAVAGWAEWLRWASEQRVANAEQALQHLAVARESALRERVNHMRRHLNRPGFRAWAAALTTLTPRDRPGLRASLEHGTWKLELETTSFESARRFASVLGGRVTVLPRRVHDGLGWADHGRPGGGMDRLAIAGIALRLVIGVVGLARGRETRVATVRRDLDRLRSIPADAQALPAITETLVLLERGMFAQPTPLRVRAQLEPGRRQGNPWAPLTGETVKITMQTDVSPMAAVAWLDIALQNYTLLLSAVQWDGRTGTVHAVALGP